MRAAGLSSGIGQGYIDMFRIDIYNASDVKIGTGPITNIISLRRIRSLDRMGGIEFQIPATDSMSQYCTAGAKYKIYHTVYGNLGTFYHAGRSVSVSGNSPALTIKANDQLIELARSSEIGRAHV